MPLREERILLVLLNARSGIDYRMGLQQNIKNRVSAVCPSQSEISSSKVLSQTNKQTIIDLMVSCQCHETR